MLMLNSIVLFLAQTRTETGQTDQASWELWFIAGILIAFVAAVFFVRRSRRAHGQPPAGSVPAAEVPGYTQSGRMTEGAEETRRQP